MFERITEAPQLEHDRAALAQSRHKERRLALDDMRWIARIMRASQ
jgi:hypothetical protein